MNFVRHPTPSQMRKCQSYTCGLYGEWFSPQPVLQQEQPVWNSHGDVTEKPYRSNICASVGREMSGVTKEHVYLVL
ncbi:hypothetical protein J6590_029361 [Homalodisca vitripennis]|nr:hypothetical protein J6590_029361 [Homalodisca vitripennis]